MNHDREKQALEEKIFLLLCVKPRNPAGFLRFTLCLRKIFRLTKLLCT